MEYKYNLAKLQYDKEKVEELITRQSRRRGQVFPKKIEQEFWQKSLVRAQDQIQQYFWAGVLSYFILVILVIPSDYWVIEPEHFKTDTIQCLLGLLNGALCLLSLYFFASIERLKPIYPYAALVIVFWAISSMAILTLTVNTVALKQQALAVICIVYTLSYIITGVKPLHLLITSMLSAVVVVLFQVGLEENFNTIVLMRILFGGALMGFVIAKMLTARERMIYLNMMSADISEKIHRIHNSELLHLSQHDQLTKISNRRTFDEMFDIFYDQARRNQTPLAILFIDVDHFKNYNDFYGHQKGDEVISSIAKAVKNAIRHMDFVARYGGEEFVVLLPETDAHGAYAVASNIYKSIDRLEIPHAKSLVSNHVTISLGITVYRNEQGLLKDDILEIADQALYRAKQLGRNQIYYQSIPRAEVA